MTSSEKRFRDRLNAEKAQIEEQLTEIEKKLENKGDYTLGEGDPTIYEWEMNLSRRRELLAKQSEIDHALGRLDAGGYIECSICGGEIEEERLGLLPTTTTCSRCARGGRVERGPKRGAER